MGFAACDGLFIELGAASAALRPCAKRGTEVQGDEEKIKS